MNRKPNRRLGYISLVELIFVMGILGFIFAMMMSALAQVRIAAKRNQSLNNLRQLAIAIHATNDVNKKMPPATGRFPIQNPNVFSPNQTLHFHILPFIEQSNLYKLGTGQKPPWKLIAKTRIDVYISPQDPKPPANNVYKNWLATTNYASNVEVFGTAHGGTASLPQSFPDGTSNTIIFAERYQMCKRHPTAWAYGGIYYWTPMFGFYAKSKFQLAPKENECDAARTQSLDKSGILVALGDGSVRFVSADLSPQTWGRACDPADGNVLGNDW